ncbi:MAG: hypothetical protein IH986_17845, partial [Planctomycetes bacterium]|nr:hypothetical protein [Planctomycetota bacterium]
MYIGTIYRKELLDILRDRRTLIAMIAVPVVLYPLLIVGILQLTHLQEKRQDAEAVEIGVPDVETRDWLADIVGAIHQDRTDRIARQRAEGTPVKDEPLELGEVLPVIVDDVRQAVDDRTVHAALDVIRLAAPRDPQLRTFQIVVDDTSDRSRS